MTDYIAYQGKVYQIEWYYTTDDLSQAYEYADQMSPQDKAKLIHLLVRMGDLGKIFDETKFRNEGDGIMPSNQNHTVSCVSSMKVEKLSSPMRFGKNKTSYPKMKKTRPQNARLTIINEYRRAPIMKTKSTTSTVAKWLSDPQIQKEYEDTKAEFLLSELLAALMQGDQKSVRELAREAKLSASVIQNIRSGKQEDMKLTNFLSIAEACGFHVELVSDKKKRIPLNFSH